MTYYLPDVYDQLAAQLNTQLGTAVPGLQVTARRTYNPSPPAIDLYPAGPAVEQAAYVSGSWEANIIVRARVNGDHDEQWTWLLLLIDPRSQQSVDAALAHDRTLSGRVSKVHVNEGPSEARFYEDVPGQGGLLGCEWNVKVTL